MAFRSAIEPIFRQKDALVFLAIADSFCRQSIQRWELRFGQKNWQAFLHQTKDLFRRFEITGMDDMDALIPPSPSDHSAFMNCYFAPEKSWAVVPREQFYRRCNGSVAGRKAFDPAVGESLNDDLLPMRPGTRQETLQAAAEAHFAKLFGEAIDHLGVLLAVLSLFVYNNMFTEAHQFLCEHFEWLPECRNDLMLTAPHASFYAMLLELVIRLHSAPLQMFYRQHG